MAAVRSRSHDAGFTLVEILVCLALIALIAALAVPRFTGQGTVSLERQAQSIARDLARLRQEAIGAGAVRRVTGQALGDTLPAGTALGALVPPEIVFFPNGMANGAVWQLEGGGQAVDLEVDWLTGGIALRAR